MERRYFLKQLGLTTAGIIIAPAIVRSISDHQLEHIPDISSGKMINPYVYELREESINNDHGAGIKIYLEAPNSVCLGDLVVFSDSEVRGICVGKEAYYDATGIHYDICVVTVYPRNSFECFGTLRKGSLFIIGGNCFFEGTNNPESI